ncbi:MAG: class I SAM-dependent methyltransferase [Oscillatoria sp. PMC 1068.18]|nr:class I SAM-dependent methyltransferase [Oscillatoria sp. PMC 1076.18]MEC4987257.1 class I SAM-dependent methyltransferase [Oscillatoria sp. PMC 1068.18]
MTVTTINKPGLASRLINGILAIKPLASFAKYKAREMMIKRAETIGVHWREEVQKLRQHDWEGELAEVENPQLVYPEYYRRSFHAYDRGNLSWDAALEVEVAAYTVHATIWEGTGAKGDPMLRESYHNLLQEQIPIQPKNILDLACSVGMSSFALQAIYPDAQVTGVDLSPYFLAVANYQNKQRQQNISWLHAAAEKTGLPEQSFDFVSAFLLFHELPQSAAKEILAEARRLLRPGGYLGIMDMNPRSPIYTKMPAYIFTLLKSTEPYLDQYFTLDLASAIADAGFEPPTIISNSPRHRTVIAKAK